MAYPLNTFNADAGTEVPRAGIGRVGEEVILVMRVAGLLFLVMAVYSY